MSRRLLPFLCLLVVSLGARCPQQPILKILGPLEGESISDCSVDISVHIKGTADPGTLTADLNGTSVSLAALTPTVYTASVPAGAPLLANNVLTVQVDATGGGMSTKVVNFSFDAAEPRARQITDSADLITGPQASSRIGDWLLENCTARFVVQDGPQRDLTGIGQYGGNLIDAELRSQPGIESFFEIQPMLNIETVVNADTITIVNDGTDGNPAVVRACGPDDLIDYINASSITAELDPSIVFPVDANDNDQDIHACTEYTLAAGDRHVLMKTEVENLDPVADVCLFVGDYLNPSGEIEQWTSEVPGLNAFGATSGIGEMFANFGFGSFSMLGRDDAAGVDYALIPIGYDDPSPCIPPFAAGASSSFSQSGVSAVLQGTSIITTLFLSFPPAFLVPKDDGLGNNKNAFTRAFAVGDGSLSNSVDLEIALKGLDSATISGCVTVAGAPSPGARVAVGKLVGGIIEEFTTHFTADADGCWQGLVPAPAAGTQEYGVAAGQKGKPYEGGATVPPFQTVDVGAGDVAGGLDVDLPAGGRVEVTVVDAAGLPVPARVTVVGSDPSPELTYSFSISGALNVTTSTFFDSTQDGIPGGVSRVEYTDAGGIVDFDLEPGTYDFVVSRGTEWSSFTASAVTVSASPAVTQIAAQIAEVLDTPGFVSSDFHVHTSPSSDSQISKIRRVRSFAGEGVDNIVATDHDRHTDLNPIIAAEGLSSFVHSTLGEEITSFDYGHFNAYPLGLDPDRITGGSTDWAGAAPVGEGFPDQTPPAAYPPSYTLLPSEIFDAVHTTTKVAGGLLNTSPEIAVQVNHFDSHFSPLKIDTANPPIRSQLSSAEKLERRFDPTTPDADFFHVFDALEIWNGYTVGHQSEFLDDRIGVWANLLNQGIKITAIYDTDTHDYFTTRQGGARSWTPSTFDAPPDVDDDEVGAAVKAGNLVGGQGIYPQARLVATNTPSTQADFTLANPTQITVLDGMVTLEIDVQAPIWAEYDTIEIYANPTTFVTGSNMGVPVLYSATPTQTLVLGTDFTRDTVVVDAGVPGASRFETQVSVPFTVAQDTWFGVVVRGTSGTSASMFPVMPASQSSGGVLALGATNALYVDVDGNGDFDGPGVLVAP